MDFFAINSISRIGFSFLFLRGLPQSPSHLFPQTFYTDVPSRGLLLSDPLGKMGSLRSAGRSPNIKGEYKLNISLFRGLFLDKEWRSQRGGESIC